mmetsp:Transcript_30489/g.73054  ORF Transcript_30489/g.73054 Transcript_30489/m.73054 type:complete len:162 (-) Transcript_30489:471-956(-)
MATVPVRNTFLDFEQPAAPVVRRARSVPPRATEREVSLATPDVWSPGHPGAKPADVTLSKPTPVTTVMVHNVPHRLQVDQLEEVLDTLGFQGKYNFVSLPKARGRKANTGFAFVNFIEEEDAQRCLAVARTFRFPGSNRRSRTTVAELQGLEANIELAKGK